MTKRERLAVRLERISKLLWDWCIPVAKLVVFFGALLVTLFAFRPSNFGEMSVAFLMGVAIYLILFFFVGLPLIAIISIMALLVEMVATVVAPAGAEDEIPLPRPAELLEEFRVWLADE